jgi:hypothetical protein
MNYYETLGVSRNSEPEVIEAAYRALMKKYHPDLWRGDEATAEPRAKLINEAFATLRDSDRRRAYDKLIPRETQPRPVKKRRKPAKPAVRTTDTHPGRHRVRVQRFATPGRPPRSRSSAYEPSVPAMIIVACVGLMAMIALASRGPSEAQLTAIGPVAMPKVEASLLTGGRKQTACITNKTTKRVNYTLFWGGTSGRQYSLDPGYYMIHSSPFSAPPLVEFFDNDGGEPTRNVVKSAITRGGAPSCQPNNSFQYKALDSTNWSGEDRYGLYGDEHVETLPAVETPPAVETAPANRSFAESRWDA